MVAAGAVPCSLAARAVLCSLAAHVVPCSLAACLDRDTPPTDADLVRCGLVVSAQSLTGCLRTQLASVLAWLTYLTATAPGRLRITRRVRVVRRETEGPHQLGEAPRVTTLPSNAPLMEGQS